MKYAALWESFASRDPYLSASDLAVGGWSRLYRYASTNELVPDAVKQNLPAMVAAGTLSKESPLGDAIIPSCRHWGARQWIAACNVDVASVEAAVDAKLCRWDGNDLVLVGFDLWGLYVCEKRREDGNKGGRPTKKKNHVDNHVANHVANHLGNPSPLPSSPSPSSPEYPPTPQGGNGVPGGSTGKPVPPVKLETYEKLKAAILRIRPSGERMDTIARRVGLSERTVRWAIDYGWPPAMPPLKELGAITAAPH